MAEQQSLEQIQGRLNQRQLPFKATWADGVPGAVLFTPKATKGVYVGWDPAVAPDFESILTFLASYGA